MDGAVNIRLSLFGEIDGLRVAAALEVEDTILVPTMLVVTDEGSLGIGGEGGLA